MWRRQRDTRGQGLWLRRKPSSKLTTRNSLLQEKLPPKRRSCSDSKPLMSWFQFKKKISMA
uniref:Uncharacterized protein n=1 Tax=Brassica oleracea TaxID=3712 RepID=A0A3P6B2K1_BRAOL|nr:unnamed protein product [Brassica oleracea]